MRYNQGGVSALSGRSRRVSGEYVWRLHASAHAATPRRTSGGSGIRDMLDAAWEGG